MKIKLKQPQTTYLVIHGHFYQPPRENPWTDTIEKQDSAYPFHNWNEKIIDECYLPNCYSKVVDSSNKIMHIVNNFEFINFNIGPTLFSYIEKNFPNVYKKIIEGDKLSQEHNNGFGNAIAQAYNHIIMPLAKRRDKITQIKWGVQEFEYRFRRKPESMWLPETAIDSETADLLIDEGLKYIILSPHQALKYRKLGAKDWTNVSEKPIPPYQPYRLFKKDSKGNTITEKYIDIFFYNAKLSNDISFGNILTNADWLADEITKNINPDLPPTQLISIATDGEVYGHHKKFADMCLSAFIKHSAPERGIKIINFANFLNMYPPSSEVELSPGSEGLGTSWSCAHGVGRWFRDCGCHTGGQPGWNQKWRKPLRDAFDKLNESLVELYEFEGKKYFKKIWEVRDDYISILLNPVQENKTKFLQKHLHSKHLLKEKSKALRLLETQKYMLYMYTSCGWFFSELSGIETLQNLKYAAKAISLASHFDEFILSSEYYDFLEQAKSNLDNRKNGRQLYQEIFKNSLYSEYNIINEFAHKCLFLKFKSNEDLYKYKIDLMDFVKKEFNSHHHLLGKIKLVNILLEEEKYFIFYLIQKSINNSQCWIMEVTEEFKFEKSPQIVEWINNPLLNENFIKMFPKKIFSISDILFDIRLKLAKSIFAERNEELDITYQKIYNENIDFINFLKSLNLNIPKELKVITEAVLKNQIKSILSEYIKEFKEEELTKLNQVVNSLLYSNLQIESDSLKLLYNNILILRLTDFFKDDNYDEMIHKQLNNLIEIGTILKIDIINYEITDLLSKEIDYIFLKLNQLEYSETLLAVWNKYLVIINKFNFNTDKLRNMINAALSK